MEGVWGGGRYSTVKPHPPQVKRELFICEATMELCLSHAYLHTKLPHPPHVRSDSGDKQLLEEKANQASKVTNLASDTGRR